MWCKIRFLGVWDTVAALGVPIKSIDVVIDRIPGLKHRHHDLRLSQSVENAYHALAIDDERKTFHPTLWDPETKKGQTIKQVWFCGMHTDVGGGYAEPELSDIALDWVNAHTLEVTYERATDGSSGEQELRMQHRCRGRTVNILTRYHQPPAA